MPAKFTSGQYKQMAEIFRDMRPEERWEGGQGLQGLDHEFWKNAVRKFCAGLCKLNPKVQPKRFHQACGLMEDE